MSRGVRIVAGLFGALFAYAAFLQLNDADPFYWVAAYGGASLAALLHAIGKPQPWLTGLVAVAALVWAGYLATVVFGGAELTPMFPDQKMTGWTLVDTEEGRELGGLVVVAVTMVALLEAWRRKPWSQ